MLFKSFIFFAFFCQVSACFSQPNYQFGLSTSKYICLKATAVLEIFGTEPADTITITWSTGQTNITQIYELVSGDYSVNIKIRRTDTLTHLKDTTFYFSISEELCDVGVDKYFSPNDDNYHDKLSIVNSQFHPNFELNIFNKWGQQVHSQKKEYTPWDGKWNGIDLPDGTYFYVFFYDAAQKNKCAKGDITILR